MTEHEELEQSCCDRRCSGCGAPSCECECPRCAGCGSLVDERGVLCDECKENDSTQE